jgi:GAF domain-containing protein
MGLPLKVGQKVIGVLDVQSQNENAFHQDDIAVLQILADQLAVAIDNAKLFNEAQTNLKQLQMMYGQYDQETWSRIRENENLYGYQLSEGELVPLRSDSQSNQEGDQGASINLPLKLRGQVIGSLDIWLKNKKLPNEEMQILEMMSERISQAMESARLFQEAQSRAAREQNLNNLVASFSRTMDFDTLLQNAVRQLGHLPNVTEVSIHVGTTAEKVSGNGNESTSN